MFKKRSLIGAIVEERLQAGLAAQPRGQQPGAAIAILEVGRMHQTLQE